MFEIYFKVEGNYICRVSEPLDIVSAKIELFHDEDLPVWQQPQQ
jgi:hypothetical protein